MQLDGQNVAFLNLNKIKNLYLTCVLQKTSPVEVIIWHPI